MKSMSQVPNRTVVIFIGFLLIGFSEQAFAQGTWETKASMPSGHYAFDTGVVNGILYALGGLNASGVLATNEAFTPEAPNQPPIANAGADQTVDATSPAGALVMLNGTGSSDPDGDSLTFSWIGPFGRRSEQHRRFSYQWALISSVLL